MQAQLTLDNIDYKLLERLKQKARQKGMDLNTFILSIFKRETELDDPPPRRQLGLLNSEASFSIADDFKMTDEEFLSS